MTLPACRSTGPSSEAGHYPPRRGSAVGDLPRPAITRPCRGWFVSIGWEELGDLRAIGPDRDALKLRLAATYPAAKPGAIPVWAGVLMRFMTEIEIGDLVISPNKADRTLNFGR